MHISDLHAGPPFRLKLAEQVAREAHELKPDLLVVSGDFVQRADFVNQARLGQCLQVGRNHDVPLFNPYNRLFRSYTRYKRYITPDLNPVFERPGLAVVGGCTAHGWTMDGGYLG